MKRLLVAIAAVSLISASVADARPDYGRGDGRRGGPPGYANNPYDLPPGQAKKIWRRGERIPRAYFVPQYYIPDPRAYRLARRNGYRWVGVNGDAYLVAIASGVIADVVLGALAGPPGYAYGPPPPPPPVISREQMWRARYARPYTYEDDSFYRECRESVDPAGVIGGAVIGGVLGNVLGGRGAGGTIAGIVVGGAAGALLTRRLDCADRSYAYRAYSDGFNRGRPNSVYRWRNPDNGHYGNFRVADYYDDPDGFRCANYTQEIFIDGRPQTATGRACQQPDGSWAVVS